MQRAVGREKLRLDPEKKERGCGCELKQIERFGGGRERTGCGEL